MAQAPPPRKPPPKRGPPKRASSVPSHIGGFPVTGLLGRGGMGNVYACRDEALGRTVAVKVLKKALAVQPEQSARFLREAQAMARIQSPNVVTVHQVGEEDGRPFLVMELLEGKDLSELLKERGRLSEKRAITFLLGAIQGLSDAAKAGVIHRDVKPANLFVENERIKLTDFGLSLHLDADAKLTQEGLVVGTPHYLAPELARGGAATQASDIYGLGATLFELVVGHPPYPGKAALDVVSAHLHKPVPSPKAQRRDLSTGIDTLIQRMMQKDAKDRYQNYDALLLAISQLTNQKAKTRVTNLLLPTGVQSLPNLTDTSEVEIPRPSLTSLPNAKALKTETLTVLLLDISKYAARTGHSDGETASRWVALFDSYLAPILRTHKGKRGKTVRDAILVTFSSATDAVQCAMALQDQFAEHNAAASHAERIEARCALSAGEVRLHKSDIMGEPVNLATQVERLAESGNIIFTDAVLTKMGESDLQRESLGEKSFKGITRRVQLYRVVAQPGLHPYGLRALEASREGVTVETLKRAISSTFDMPQEKVSQNVRKVVGASWGIVAGALLALGIVFVVGVFLARESEPTPGEVVQRLQNKETPTAVQSARLGSALMSLGERDAALLAFTKAAKQEMAPQEALDFGMAELGRDNADDVLLNFFDAWPDPSVITELRSALAAPEWWMRHNALVLLERKGRVTDEEREGLATLDVQSDESCVRRKWGMRLLTRVGTGDDALLVLKGLAGDDCLRKLVPSAQRVVSARRD